jgi:hypothetical protein
VKGTVGSRRKRNVSFVLREAQEEIVSGSARCTTATFAACLDHGAHQRQLGLMERQPFGENGVVTTFETFDESRSQRNAPFSCSIRDVTGAAQQPLHLARPLMVGGVSLQVTPHRACHSAPNACSSRPAWSRRWPTARRRRSRRTARAAVSRRDRRDTRRLPRIAPPVWVRGGNMPSCHRRG